MTEIPNVAAVLRNAAEHIAKTGLYKGALYEGLKLGEGERQLTKEHLDSCKVCAFGAINWAITGSPTSLWEGLQRFHPGIGADGFDRAYEVFDMAQDALLEAIEHENPAWWATANTWRGVPEFNDDPDTTAEQVIHVLTVAANNVESMDTYYARH